MKKVYCLLNHLLTERQITELRETFAACDVIYPPEDLSRLWAQIPTTEKIDTSVIASVADWLFHLLRKVEQVQKQHIFEHICFRQYAYYPEF